MSPVTVHFVIDLETLAISTDAVVISIGVASFSRCDLNSLIQSYQYNLSVTEQLFAGRVISPDTVAWWKGNSAAVQELAYFDPLPAAAAVVSTFELMKEELDKENQIKVWGNSPSFDLRILESLATDFNIPVPWKFRDEADVRTISTLLGKRPKVEEGLAHSARHDAVAEALLVQEALRKSFGERNPDNGVS